jgi:SAM-dependent methyltransferase
MKLRSQQKQWNQLAVQDPLWAILANPDKRNRRWDLDEFFATGRDEVQELMHRIEGLGYPAARGCALDFGCGIGRNTQALADWFDHVTGVDIAPAMLDLARKRNRTPARCDYLLNADDDLRTFPDATFDFVYSRLVLQHVAAHHARRYIREFLRVVRPSGLVLFQLPARRRPRPAWQALASHTYRLVAGRIFRVSRVVEMNGVPREIIVRDVEESGGRILDVRNDDSAGPAWENYLYAVTK